MIIDCHTHWGIGWQDRDKGDPAKWLAHLDRHGVSMALLMGHANLVYADRCRQDNEVVASIAARVPDRIIPIGSAWPQLGQAGLDEVRHCTEDLGMKGLKFHPWMQGFSTADSVFGEMCAYAGEKKVPVIFHDGTPCYSLSEQIGGLARRFPRTWFVMGHSGLLWNWRSAIAAALQPNVWVCLCGPHMRAIEILCQRADPSRLLWGTDFGFGFADAIPYRMRVLTESKVSPELREKIFGQNPLRLLRMAPPAPAPAVEDSGKGRTG